MGSKTFEKLFCQMLVTARFVTEEQVRVQMEHGNLAGMSQQRENAKQLLSVVYRYDVKSAPRENRQAVQQQIDRIKALVLAYNAEMRVRTVIRNGEDSITRLTRIYDDLISAGHEFCVVAFPHLILDYDDKFGLMTR